MILEAFGFRKKYHVGISISVNNFIELIHIDEKTKNVTKYVSGNIKYNSALRGLIDYNELNTIIQDLFIQAGLEPSECAVTVCIPNVFIKVQKYDNTPLMDFEDDLEEDIKDLYIFKKAEPSIKYTIVDNNSGEKTIIAGAIQQMAISQIIECVESSGAEIVRIESSYTSLIKTLSYCDKFNKLITPNNTSVVLIITSNSCSSLYLKGFILSGIEEEPLAVKSFSVEEVYSVVAKIATNSISKNNPQALLIISETDEVDAEQLSSSLNFSGNIDYINKSLNRSEDFIDIDPYADVDESIASNITLEAVSAAISDYGEYPIDLNFLPQDKIPQNIIKVGDKEGNLNTFLILCIVTGLIIGVLIFGILKFVFSAQIQSMNRSKGLSEDKTNVFKTNIASQDNNKKSIFPVLQKISENNKKVIDVYNSLSSDIPEEIYIKRFIINPQGGIGILGESRNTEAVNNFIKGLKDKDDSLMVSKLSANDPSIDPTVTLPNGITFEIKTTTVDVQFQGDLLQQQYMHNNNNSGENPDNPPVI